LTHREKVYFCIVIFQPIFEKPFQKPYDISKALRRLVRRLFVDPSWPYLGASPDGLIGTEGLVEVKCLYAIGDQSPRDAAATTKGKNMCVQFVNNELKIKVWHNYHYQIQGQLNIADRQFCDLVLYSIGEIDVS
jgi:YqaJ-like viral recombinase domain